MTPVVRRPPGPATDRLPAPPTGALVAVLAAAGALLIATTGSDAPTILAAAAAVIALAWLHVLLATLIDPRPSAPPGPPVAGPAGPPARVMALRAELDRAIGRPQYDRTVRPLLAGLALDRLGRRGIDPATPAGRAAAADLLGPAPCAYLFPGDEAPPPLDRPGLADLLSTLEEL